MTDSRTDSRTDSSTAAWAHPRTDADVRAAVAGQTVPVLFARTVAARGDAPALRWKVDGGWQQWTWREYGDRAARWAGALTRLGVGKGQRVALMLRNRAEFHPADMGVYLTGATAFSIYNSSSPEQTEYQLGHSEATVAVVEEAFLDKVLSVRARLPALREVVVVRDGESADRRGCPAWDALVDAADPVDLQAAAASAVTPDDVATFIYTSGTTGPPKAVMLTHANVCWLLESLVESLGLDLAGQPMLSYLPMAHVAERVFTHYLPSREGATVTPCPDLAQIGAYLPEVRPVSFFGPPRVFEKTRSALVAALSANPQTAEALQRGLEAGRARFDAVNRGETPSPEVAAAWEQADTLFSGLRARIGLDNCRVALTGAAPPPVEVMEFFNFVGVPLVEVYGLSEDTGLMTTDVRRPRLGTVGRAVPGCEIRLLEDGEVLCRGGHVFPGYFKDPEKTAEVLDAEGWLHTGDVGVLDDDGYVRIIDRKKELIITAGGKNISPVNIEARLKQIPLVGQACVIGDKRPYPSAILVLDPELTAQWAKDHDRPGASPAELAADPDVLAEIDRGLDAVNAGLSQVEKVKRYTLVADEWLPDSEVLTPTMKLKRRGVLARYEHAIEAMYAG